MRKSLCILFAFAACVAMAATQRVTISAYRVGEDAALKKEGLSERVSPTLAYVSDKISRTTTNECEFAVVPPTGERFARWVQFIGVNPIANAAAMTFNSAAHGTTNEVADAATSFVWTQKNGTSPVYIIVDFDYVVYSLDYDANGGTGSLQGESQSYTNAFNLATASGVLSRTGYSFAGWTNAYVTAALADGALVSGETFGVDCTNDAVTLHAVWEPETYTVTFDPGEGTLEGGAMLDVVYDAAYPALPVPARQGYRFANWYYTSGEEEIALAEGDKVAIAQDATFHAKWVEQVTASFKDDKTSAIFATVSVDKGVKVAEAPTAPSHTGYRFDKWSPAIEAIAVDTTYTAIYAANTYTVVFNAADGSGNSTSQAFTYDAGETALNSVPFAREGYVFAGWLDEATGSVYSDGQKVSNLASEGTFNLYAIWEPIEYSITFAANGGAGEMDDLTGIEYDAVTRLPSCSFSLDNYDFAYWTTPEGLIYDDESDVLNLTNEEATIVFTANWTAQVSDLSKAMHCAVLSWVNDGVDETSLWVPAYGEGLGYKGSGSESQVANSNSSWAFMSVKSFPTTGKVTFWWKSAATGGGGAPALKVECNGEAAIEVEAVETDGDWNKGEVCISDATKEMVFETNEAGVISIDQVLWTPDDTPVTPTSKYNVTFDANGGEGGWSKACTVGAVVTPPVVEREGYEFGGWTPEVAATVPASNVVYTAVWGVNSYLVTFDAGEDGEGGTSEELEYGSQIVAPTVTRTGYDFAGWSPEVASTVPASNLVYTAEWNIASYSVTFVLGNGKDDVTGEQEYASAIVAPEPEREGWTFAGWTPEVAATVPASNVVYTATWSVNSYLVTFDAGEGTGGWSKELEYASSLAAPAVKRPGYVFVGWYPEVPLTVPAGDITFTAQWEALSGITFTAETVAAYEGESLVVEVMGGGEKASGVKLYAIYNTATAADLDLKNVLLDGESVKNFKFPFQLSWAAGESGVHTLEIPLKADTAVEAPEFFTLQLADATGMECGEFAILTATVADASYDALAAKMDDGTATRAETNTWTRLQPKGAYIRGLAIPADGGKVSGGGVCADGKKVTLKAAASRHFVFSRWVDEAGAEVATTPSLVIDRTAKPAASTKTSTTISDVSENATFYAEFTGDPRVIIAAVDSAVGSTSGAGRYVPGKTATVRATAKTNYVFSEWLDADGNRLTQQAAYSFAMPEEEVELTPVFVLKSEDAAYGVVLEVAGAEMDAGATPAWTNMCGFAVDWPIATDTLSAATVAVSGLPAGLKLVQDKATKTYSIVGAPTAASKSGKLSNVKITVTTAARTKVVYNLTVFVEPLPSWAVGTFNGAMFAGEDETSVTGLVSSLTVSAAGRISLKLPSGTFAATSFETIAATTFPALAGRNIEESPYGLWNEGETAYAFGARVAGKVNRVAVTNYIQIAETRIAASTDEGYATRGEASGEGWRAWQNLWKAEPYKTAIKTLGKAKALEVEDGVTLKFATSGAVTASGRFAVANPRTGKAGVYSASCSTVLVPCEDDASLYRVCVAFPAKAASGFEGYGACYLLRWSGGVFILED